MGKTSENNTSTPNNEQQSRSPSSSDANLNTSTTTPVSNNQSHQRMDRSNSNLKTPEQEKQNQKYADIDEFFKFIAPYGNSDKIQRPSIEPNNSLREHNLKTVINRDTFIGYPPLVKSILYSLQSYSLPSTSPVVQDLQNRFNFYLQNNPGQLKLILEGISVLATVYPQSPLFMVLNEQKKLHEKFSLYLVEGGKDKRLFIDSNSRVTKELNEDKLIKQIRTLLEVIYSTRIPENIKETSEAKEFLEWKNNWGNDRKKLYTLNELVKRLRAAKDVYIKLAPSILQQEEQDLFLAFKFFELEQQKPENNVLNDLMGMEEAKKVTIPVIKENLDINDLWNYKLKLAELSYQITVYGLSLGDFPKLKEAIGEKAFSVIQKEIENFNNNLSKLTAIENFQKYRDIWDLITIYANRFSLAQLIQKGQSYVTLLGNGELLLEADKKIYLEQKKFLQDSASTCDIEINNNSRSSVLDEAKINETVKGLRISIEKAVVQILFLQSNIDAVKDSSETKESLNKISTSLSLLTTEIFNQNDKSITEIKDLQTSFLTIKEEFKKECLKLPLNLYKKTLFNLNITVPPDIDFEKYPHIKEQLILFTKLKNTAEIGDIVDLFLEKGISVLQEDLTFLKDQLERLGYLKKLENLLLLAGSNPLYQEDVKKFISLQSEITKNIQKTPEQHRQLHVDDTDLKELRSSFAAFDQKIKDAVKALDEEIDSQRSSLGQRIKNEKDAQKKEVLFTVLRKLESLRVKSHYTISLQDATEQFTHLKNNSDDKAISDYLFLKEMYEKLLSYSAPGSWLTPAYGDSLHKSKNILQSNCFAAIEAYESGKEIPLDLKQKIADQTLVFTKKIERMDVPALELSFWKKVANMVLHFFGADTYKSNKECTVADLSRFSVITPTSELNKILLKIDQTKFIDVDRINNADPILDELLKFYPNDKASEAYSDSKKFISTPFLQRGALLLRKLHEIQVVKSGELGKTYIYKTADITINDFKEQSKILEDAQQDPYFEGIDLTNRVDKNFIPKMESTKQCASTIIKQLSKSPTIAAQVILDILETLDTKQAKNTSKYNLELACINDISLILTNNPKTQDAFKKLLSKQDEICLNRLKKVIEFCKQNGCELVGVTAAKENNNSSDMWKKSNSNPNNTGTPRTEKVNSI